MKNKRLYKICICSFFVAVIAVCAQISFVTPFSSIPFNLALLGVFLAGGFLGEVLGSICVIIYILLGFLGIPVFAGFMAGPSVLFGPTGGFIIGYIFVAFITGVFSRKFKNRPFYNFLGMGSGLLICYIFGALWYMNIGKIPLLFAFTSSVLPFIIGDFIKIFASLILLKRLDKFIL
ncbi:MAG: biotin transporter BioY [Clostridia bacterium]|nr:biotin transporter BioY [Clostridia bacterium]